jgi:hypothetical protein
MHILNNRFYMTNGSLLLVEDSAPFSAISQLHYEYYDDANKVLQNLKQNESIQCVVGYQNMSFGSAQQPQVCDYADGIDTMEFLQNLGR